MSCRIYSGEGHSCTRSYYVIKNRDKIIKNRRKTIEICFVKGHFLKDYREGREMGKKS